MFIDIFTLFPIMFDGVMRVSMWQKAQKIGAVRINLWDIRDFSRSKQYKIDAPPFGGGPGMVMRIEPLIAGVEQVKSDSSWVIYLSASGRRFDQEKTEELASKEHLVLICGHYEGIDQRIIDLVVDEELSVGDYILTGGEVPAMVVVDTIIRLLPGVLGDSESLSEESFSNGLLEYPHYTRPERFRDRCVPDVLLSGNHNAIKEWRMEKAMERTKLMRPDLLKNRRKGYGDG